ncbi:MAG TPA: HAD family hydrolase [Candidatus Tenderia electrophaga]|uniref:Histidinol-phosphatase n=1 Tax=Candidatus Tenderia electrophaga TaxID=1748243 RepID=A0A832N5F6_9GAMM|nr:HAD family hydrolase [Candidatus Tenderia electrophaga]
MDLAIFDLDNTLLNGDSDYLWGRFLAAEGIVDGDFYERENQRFYDEYKAGTLNILEFLRFSLQPLADNELEKMQTLRQKFVETHIDPIILPKARKLLKKHSDQGHTLLIITATNTFVTQPIAAALGVDNLIGTDPEFKDGRYTGKVSGTPSFREGKVTRLNSWLANNGHNLASSWFYSDSHNDLPLLEMVTHPVAVDADDTLLQHAAAKGWDSISLRD